MVGEVRSVLTRPQAPAGEQKKPVRWLLLVGLGAFVAALGLYVIYTVIHPKSFTMDPVDLAVYRSGGLIVRHVRPLYDPRLAAPLYDWVGYGKLHLPFTYTPFAAIAFAVISFVPWWLSQQLSVAVDILALLAALWLTLGGLGYRRDKTRRSEEHTSELQSRENLVCRLLLEKKKKKLLSPSYRYKKKKLITEG